MAITDSTPARPEPPATYCGFPVPEDIRAAWRRWDSVRWRTTSHADPTAAGA